jgi:hypothetical protein
MSVFQGDVAGFAPTLSGISAGLWLKILISHRFCCVHFCVGFICQIYVGFPGRKMCVGLGKFSCAGFSALGKVCRFICFRKIAQVLVCPHFIGCVRCFKKRRFGLALETWLLTSQ